MVCINEPWISAACSGQAELANSLCSTPTWVAKGLHSPISLLLSNHRIHRNPAELLGLDEGIKAQHELFTLISVGICSYPMSVPQNQAQLCSELCTNINSALVQWILVVFEGFLQASTQSCSELVFLCLNKKTRDPCQSSEQEFGIFVQKKPQL